MSKLPHALLAKYSILETWHIYEYVLYVVYNNST